MEYFGNLFLRPVVDGEHDPGEPNAEIQIKKYLLSSNGSLEEIRGNIFFIDEKLPKEPWA